MFFRWGVRESLMSVDRLRGVQSCHGEKERGATPEALLWRGWRGAGTMLCGTLAMERYLSIATVIGPRKLLI